MKIPVFPLNGALMFPKTNLPLNIFEEKYIDMIDYSLSNNRIIGMVQHKPNNELYNIGCYGKITVFNETPDKKYLINLEGINCFKIIRELRTDHKFRICEIEIFDDYNNNTLEDISKLKILESFEKYSRLKNLKIGFNEISALNTVDLLKLIVMISPFDIEVKQMFLELRSNKDLYEKVISALEIETITSKTSNSIN